MTAATWKTERGLSALLWFGIWLLLLAIGQQMRIMTLIADSQMLDKPPPIIKTTITNTRSVPEIEIQPTVTASLFQLVKLADIERSPPTQDIKSENKNNKPKMPGGKPHLWEMQVERSHISEGVDVNEIVRANEQLQSGDVHLARESLLKVLMHDAHSVEAIEAMVSVSRQLGDVENVHTYEEKLRQEIPEYDDGQVHEVSLADKQN